ncbi:hypothetical protein TNCV_3150081 [Trichonephila clavipes]|nr:hypothetical protein TNCV_3150081 [Trichonephila clavipes]
MKEPKINFKFCFKLGNTPKETYVMLVRVYEDQGLSMKCVYEWFARFRKPGKVVVVVSNAIWFRLRHIRAHEIHHGKELGERLSLDVALSTIQVTVRFSSVLPQF